ncbi:FAD:protein FMN transferase [Novosphingobium album (ex Liu et al. 2023)]|nr:FAD:protein FMN transferase [Novosphingobium album (ex Liu et al. 2023)]
MLDAALIAECRSQDGIVALGGETMGTRWNARLALAADRDAAPLAGIIQARLDAIVAQMSHWEPGSLLSRHNRAPAGSWTELPADFAAVIAGALTVAERSGGAFDPAIGRLTDAWGLGPRPVDRAPDVAAIAAARADCGWQRLAYDAETARLRQPGGVWLDLSGIAKGYAADAVADALAAAGVRHALVEVGGECVGRGVRPDCDPWWVELETPEGFALPPLRVALHQLAVATSGDYLRGAHTLDPATGRPPAQAATAVSVIHPSCMLADAWASALGVLAPAPARALAERELLAARLLFRDGTEWLSSALAAML